MRCMPKLPVRYNEWTIMNPEHIHETETEMWKRRAEEAKSKKRSLRRELKICMMLIKVMTDHAGDMSREIRKLKDADICDYAYGC